MFFQPTEENSLNEGSDSFVSVPDEETSGPLINRRIDGKDDGRRCKLHFVPSGFFNLESGNWFQSANEISRLIQLFEWLLLFSLS